jgi:Putative transposase/Transposase zinc-binding domain
MPTFQRPRLELAEVVRRHGPGIDSELSGAQRRILRDIAACRTAALGGHVQVCDHCHHQRIAYNSCRNRHCPKCQASAAARWMMDRAEELLPVEYFHVVFTLPDTFNALALANKRIVYGVLFDAVAQTLLEVAANPKHLGARIGFMGILHTWGQNLSLHPHVHCIVPGGGITPDGSARLTAGGKWVNCRPGFFLPVRVLSKVFRGKFIDLLKRARGRGLLVGADDDRQFDQLLDAAVKHDWVVYAKPPFGGPEQVLKYLSRYTHRIAISNRRLLSVNNESVTFNYKDYAHRSTGLTTGGNRPRSMTLDGGEFLRRFLMHAVPSGFMRIRHFGLLANRVRAGNLALCRGLLSASSPADCAVAVPGQTCPVCQHGRMISGPNLDPMQLHRLLIRLDSS